MQEQAFVCLLITRISNPAQKVWYIFRQMVLNFYCNNEVVFILELSKVSKYFSIFPDPACAIECTKSRKNRSAGQDMNYKG